MDDPLKLFEPDAKKRMYFYSPKKSKIKGYGPVSAILVVILAYFGSQIVAGILIGLVGSIFGQNVETTLKSLEDSALMQFSYIAIIEVVSLSILWNFMRQRSISFSDIGLGRKPLKKDLSPAFVTFVVYFTALIVVTAIVSKLIPGLDLDQEQQLGFDTITSNTDLVFVFISLVILPPIVEEIMVRGFLYTGLRKKFKKISSAIIASLIFGFAHLQLGSGVAPLWIAAIDTALLSLFLIYLREKTGALWAPMMVHAIKNGLAFFLLFLIKV